MLANITSVPRALYNRLWPERTVQCSSDLLYLTQFHSKTKSTISLMIFIPHNLRSTNLPLAVSDHSYTRFVFSQYQDSNLVLIQTLNSTSYLRWTWTTTKTWYIPTVSLDQSTSSFRHIFHFYSPFKLRRRLGSVPTFLFSFSFDKIH